jgi:hypothetical protein
MLDPMMNPIAGGMWSNLHYIVPILGFAGVVIGSVIAFRRSRFDIESAARWRYREPALESSDLKALRPRRRWDGLTGRAVARAMIVFAALVPLAVLIALVAQPGHIGGGMLYEPQWYEVALPWAGAIGYLVGLGWMICIYRRSHIEPDTSYWRYRD